MKAPISILLVSLFAVSSAQAALWERRLESGKGSSTDTPQPHSLAWFTRDPFLRDDGDDLCSSCTPEDKATIHLHHKVATELIKVGILHGFEIYNLFYRFDDHVASGEIDWKSILVKVAPGKYREIYHLQPTAAIIKAAYVLHAGSQEILATRDQIPGTGNYYYEDYFVFSSAGASLIDTTSINKALQSLLPAGEGVRKGGGLDMESLTYRMPVWKDADPNCCPSGGRVDLKLGLDGDRVTVLSKHFDPSAKSGDDQYE